MNTVADQFAEPLAAPQRQLQQAAKMEAIERLAGGIAHDFNNILGAILGFGELAQSNLGEGSAVRHQVDQVMHAGMRGKGLVDRMCSGTTSTVTTNSAGGPGIPRTVCLGGGRTAAQVDLPQW